MAEPSHGFVEEGPFTVGVGRFWEDAVAPLPVVAVVMFFVFGVGAGQKDAAGAVVAGDDGGVVGLVIGA